MWFSSVIPTSCTLTHTYYCLPGSTCPQGSMSNTPGGRVLKITVPASANSEQEEEILDLDTIVTNVNQVRREAAQ